MPDSPSAPVAALPRWCVLVASLAIVFHFVAVLSGALAAHSGPWPSPDEPTMEGPPAFAASLHQAVGPSYLSWLKLTHNYHFPSNMPNVQGTYFEVRLKDAQGQEITTLRFPDPQANAEVRSLQQELARWLVDDVPFRPPQGERIAAPGREADTMLIWNPTGERRMNLQKVPEHLIDRDRPIYGPSDWSLLLARSYERYLCRKHGAASAELIRHVRFPIPPSELKTTEDDVRPDDNEDLVANFGELLK
jgi:hypothetical protein